MVELATARGAAWLALDVLCDIHGSIRGAEQRVFRFAVFGEECVADASGTLENLAAKLKLGIEAAFEAERNVCDLGVVVDTGQQDCEFVASDASEHVGWAQLSF